jgi:hypothetical protein
MKVLERSHSLSRGATYRLGSEAKPTRSEKVEVELIFHFRSGKKHRCIHCDTLRIFSCCKNVKSDSRAAFAAGWDLATLPLASTDIHDGLALDMISAQIPNCTAGVSC